MVNPSWRDLDGRFRSLKGKLQRQLAEFAALTLHPETDDEAMPNWEKKKSELLTK